MAQIVDLLQSVAQKIRRCPEPTLVHAYREAARQFCLESRWLRRTVDVGLAANADDATVLLLESADADLEIIGVRNVRGISVADPQSSWTLRPDDPTRWPPNQDAAQPHCYAYQPEDVLLLPAPADAAYTLRVTAQCMPIDGTETLPDDLVRKWSRMLDCGALAYLYEVPGQPWSAPVLARKEALKFQAAINNAKGDEQRSYNSGTVMARIRRLF